MASRQRIAGATRLTPSDRSHTPVHASSIQIERRRRIDPGVVHEDVDPTVDAERVSPQSTRRRPVTEVDRERAARSPRSAARRREPFLVHVVDQEGRPGRRQRSRRRGPDPARRTGDQHDPVRQIDQHCPSDALRGMPAVLTLARASRKTIGVRGGRSTTSPQPPAPTGEAAAPRCPRPLESFRGLKALSDYDLALAGGRSTA